MSALRKLLARLAGLLRRRPARTCRIFVDVAPHPWGGLYHAQWWVLGDGVKYTGIRRATTRQAAGAIAAMAADDLAERLGFPLPDGIERGVPCKEVGRE